MFVSQKQNVNKKAFQIPNILRRKPKVLETRAAHFKITESLGLKPLVSSTHVEGKTVPAEHEEMNVKSDGTIATKPISTRSVVWKVWSAENNNCEPRETAVDASINSKDCVDIPQSNNIDQRFNKNPLNIETFINTGAPKQSMSLLKSEASVTSGNKNIQDNDCRLSETEQKQNILIGALPSIVTPTSQLQPNLSQETAVSTTPTQAIFIDCFTNRAVKFKCDEPNCNKGFWSEERLRKHKNSHKRQSTARPPGQTNIECPVKKISEDGTEVKCERTFVIRGDLLKHLNADHTPEDALHRCGVCGRRFFWAGGLRAHGASSCARGGLVCAWPGCGRVFRLPCRLREHARAHTGDRPYLCRYPDCGWAFRSASKLVRHARRHTGERRHKCSACPRAFLRREHLRDHTARHHAPRPHTCEHTDCGQTFTNMSTLYTHMKKVHKKDVDGGVTTAADTDVTSTTENVEENVFLAQVSARGGSAHAARTHCTWPLARAPATSSASAPAALLLEDDAHLEQSDGTSGNVYTVRSDLFLHGNVHIDEDSQHIGNTMVTATAPLDVDLCLIDSHPTIGLMQEELMYDDTAVDESSFRVLLMNGEELT